MTDNDFDNLLATAGSISASPAARKIVQLALTENSRIALQIADISSQAISGTMDRLVATQKINELMQSSPLTDEMKSQLRAISGDATDDSSLGDIDAADAEILALETKKVVID
jgi:glutamate mutase epsilon subunit